MWVLLYLTSLGLRYFLSLWRPPGRPYLRSVQWENSAVMLYLLQRASETQNQQAAQVSFTLTLTAWHTSLSTPWLVCYTWDQAAGHSVINLHPLLEAALLVLWAADYLQVNRCGLTSQGLFCRCGRSLALAGRRDSGHITENKWTKGLQRGKRESQSSSEVCSVFLLFTHDWVIMSLYGGPKLPTNKQTHHIIGNNYYENVMYLLYWFHLLHYLLFTSFLKLFLIFIVLVLAAVDLHIDTPATTARKQRRKERKENAYVQGNVYKGAKQK